MIKKYRVVFLGLLQGKEEVKRKMSQLGVPGETVDELIRKAPIVIKRDITLKEARLYADSLQEAGCRVIIQECGYFEESRPVSGLASITPLRDFTVCPECGFKQVKGGACIKCGFRLKRRGESPSA